MSVQAGPIYKRYTANGLATYFPIPFKVMDAGDLQITLDGVLVTSGFTLGPLGGDSTSCTFTVAPVGSLLFQLVLPFQRLTDYQTNGDLLAITINNDLDRIWLALKQLIGSNDRALSTDITEPEGVAPLPLKALRAEKVLAFDADSNPVASSLTLAQLEDQPVIAAAAAAAAAASASAASDSAAAASNSKTSAADSELAAQEWAENPEDTPVAPGVYSAHHWANKAAASAALAAPAAGSIQAFATNSPPTGWLKANGAAVSRATYAPLFAALVTAAGFTPQAFTVTLATPGVFTKVAHGLQHGARVRLATTGALPTGLNATTDYFVEVINADTFYLSLTLMGTRLATSGAQSGVHSFLQSWFGLGDGATTFNLPDLRGEFLRGWDDGRGVDVGRQFGTSQLDAFQGHWHNLHGIPNVGANAGGASQTQGGSLLSAAAVQAPISDGVNGTPRIAAETRPRNVAVLVCIKY